MTHPFISAHLEALCTGYRPGPDGIFVLCAKRADHPIHAVPAKPAEVTMYYTFGFGTDRRDRYVKITAESAEHCRVIMLNHFGRDWAFDYTSVETPQAYGLTELPRDQWPPSTCLYEVNKDGVAAPKG